MSLSGEHLYAQCSTNAEALVS